MLSPGLFMAGIYPLVNVYIAIENGPVEIVDFPIDSMVIFHSYVSLPMVNMLIFTLRNMVDLSIVFPIVFLYVETRSGAGHPMNQPWGSSRNLGK